ncbi:MULTISPECIES: ERF family protein [Granulicatella]|uniref:ERF family protein n=1 Tax=Granulicatella TaxID=117563 RepID=UPI00069D0BC0|nr:MULTISPECIES: ERF family protein [unclassified Granulicatella]
MKLHEKLIAIQTKLKAPKGQYNSFGNFNYRSAEDILEAVKPLNAEQGLLLTITDEIKEVGGRIYVVATATVSDGTDELKVSAFAREPENKKGMDESQITGATSSYARKYALNGLYAIDDNKDADTDEHKQQQENALKKQPAQKQQQKEPTEKELHEIVEKYVRNIEALGVERAQIVDYVCNKHSVGNLFDLKPNVLVGELKAIYLSKKGQTQSKGGKTKTW